MEAPPTASPSVARSILVPGETCWKIARADRATVLVDAAAYFATLRQTLLRARQSVYIAGWDIDSRVDLAPDGTDDGEPTRLRDLLCRLVERTPDLRVNLLLWDYSTLYALDREPLPRVALGWQTPARIEICLDDQVPLGASHHQKLVVIDDSLAFCGGLDLATRRWDTSEHDPGEPARVDPEGERYGPFHDIQMMVDGDAAVALADLVHQRWHEASCRPLAPVRPSGAPWPQDIAADMTDVDVAIARTLPRLHDRAEAREIEALYVAAIATAERLVYIENQYLTVDRVAGALARRMKERPDLEAVLVAPRTCRGWMETKAMGAGRQRFMQKLKTAGVAGRVRLVHPAVAEADGTPLDILVHAKAMIVDDRFVTIGSANLNNRSMGFDSECNLAIEALDAASAPGPAITGIRNRLLGEHLGLPPDEVGRRLDAGQSALSLIDAHRMGRRRLMPIVEPEEDEDDLIVSAVTSLADPERPIGADELLLDLFGGITRRTVWPWARKAAIAAAAIGSVIALWRWTPLSRLADLDTLQSVFEAVGTGPLAPLAILAFFVAGGLVFFPVTVLITLTAIVFHPLLAFAYAAGGALASAAVTYALGIKLGRPLLRRLIGRRLNAVSRTIDNRGVLAVMMLRVAPVAPFTAINLVCGAARIRFADYMIGSVLGMVPGIAVLTTLGGSVRRIIDNPTPLTLLLGAAAIGLWIVVGLGLQKLLGRWRIRRRSREGTS